MSFIKYELEVNSAIYQQMEELRKSYRHEEMTRDQALDLFKAMGLPSESPKFWELSLKYQLIHKKGVTRFTRYIVQDEPYAYKTLQKLQNEFYNGHVPKKEENKPKEKEVGRTVLNDEFCINYLKQRGYMIFKLSPNLIKLQRNFTPQFLLETMDAELK